METNKTNYGTTIAPLYRGKQNMDNAFTAVVDAAKVPFDQMELAKHIFEATAQVLYTFWNQYEIEVKDRNVDEIRNAMNSITAGSKIRIKALRNKTKDTSPDAFIELYSKEQVAQEKAAYFAKKNAAQPAL